MKDLRLVLFIGIVGSQNSSGLEIIYRRSYPSSNKSYDGVTWDLADEAAIFSVPRGTILKSGLVLGENGEAHNFGHWYWKAPTPLPNVTQVSSHRQVTYLSVVQIYQDGFVHIPFDTIPKFSFCCEFLQKSANWHVVVLVVSKMQSELIREVCPPLNASRFEILDPSKPLAAKEIWVPQFCRNCTNAGLTKNENDPLSLKMGLTNMNIMQPLGPVRTWKQGGQFVILYVGRKRGVKRSVTNERELLENLRSLPNVEVREAHMVNDWKKDRKSFENVDMIFGPHGGAMANMLFASPGTMVVELLPLVKFKKQGINERPCYFGLALALGLPYTSIAPETFSFEEPMKVNCEHVMEAMRNLLPAENAVQPKETKLRRLRRRLEATAKAGKVKLLSLAKWFHRNKTRH